ncbi:MAG: hypothetical protein ABEI27_03000 [Halobellus sp.]|uniref:hypothetical protein n=1 Tax=Halobellus sp. TaxID=1979212 RepID=UPI0035D3E71F
MSSSVLELAPELVEVFVFGLGSAGFSVVGAYIGQFALAMAQHGEPKLGLWAAVIGAVALYFACYLAADKVVPAWAEFRAVTDGKS